MKRLILLSILIIWLLQEYIMITHEPHHVLCDGGEGQRGEYE